jgi:hypothetical protein
MFRGGTASELPQLGEDEPHPVAPFRSRFQLGEGGFDHAILGVDEPLQIVRVAHAGIMGLAPAAEKSGSRLLMRREHPRQNIKEDHHRPGQQSQRHQAEADDRRVDAAVIGETGGDTHELGVAAVDQETSVHSGFLWLKWLQTIGSEVAAETSRIADRNAPAKIVAVSRAEVIEANIDNPLGISSNPTIGPVPDTMQGACQLEKVFIFQ